MGELRPWHIAVLVVVLILLFGSKRLPDAARGLGRSLRILKAEAKGLADDAPTGGGQAPAAPTAPEATHTELMAQPPLTVEEISQPSTVRTPGD